MSLRLCLTMSCVLVLTLGCTTKIEGTDGCAAFRVVALKSATASYLATNDRRALEAIIGNNETGVKLGCWSPLTATSGGASRGSELRR